MMILTLHNLAKTYKMLPSEALSKGTTFDLYVLDTFHRYSKYQEAKANGKAAPAPQLTQEQMKAMIARAKQFKPKERKV
jgi:hypothetical protein